MDAADHAPGGTATCPVGQARNGGQDLRASLSKEPVDFLQAWMHRVLRPVQPT